MVNAIIRFCLENKLVVTLVLIAVLAWGVMVAPFAWNIEWVERSPVPVDAIPDIGENQQIVFTEWMGRSTQDVEDQITYPLTVSLLGIPGVKTIRSYSYMGYSSIFIIFNEDIEFYWSRSRIVERLNSLPPGTLPEGVSPALGPDATGLGQVFWYTLEGRDPQGNPTGGWDLHELRSVQDWYVRYGLLAAEGVSDVASVGGFVQEYQIDVDPRALRQYDIALEEVYEAVRMSNVDVGARSIEVNRVDYVIRGLGFIRSVEDIEKSVVKVVNNVPVTVKDIAVVALGPALRQGALDKEGAEAVGGVVIVRYGENPLEVIENVKNKIAQISAGLPEKTLPDGTVSKVTVVPFYDRTNLIYETLATLNDAIYQQILVTIIVVVVMVNHLRSSILISALLPIAVLMTFIAMKVFGVDANIVALSGIAIAIGTMVDMGVVICENILRHLETADENENKLEVIYRAAAEVSSAILTAITTTIISFLPVFSMEAAEGKLFRPLAFTKTFALIASIIVALTLIPPFAHILFTAKIRHGILRKWLNGLLILAGIWTSIFVSFWIGILALAVGLYYLFEDRIPAGLQKRTTTITNILLTAVVAIFLTLDWMPVGPQRGLFLNFIFVFGFIGGMMAWIMFFTFVLYEPILRWCLNHKALFLAIPLTIFFGGIMVWQGAANVFGFLPNFVLHSRPFYALQHAFPGLGQEFMPPLDEGSFLYMPTTMPHASIGEAMDVVQTLDMAINSIPEVEEVVGKIGRADTPIDPAPISMLETVINYKPEFMLDEHGRRMTFRFDTKKNEFIRDASGELIQDRFGKPYRQWRDHIQSTDDIWDEIIKAAQLPGTTSAPKLQPIATRLVMLQSGMRAPMGVKVYGPDLETIDRVSQQIERYLKEVPSVESNTVIADRNVGQPYLEINIDRSAIARYGISIRQIQDVIEIALGGVQVTTTVEGRERYPVRVRYLRELRDDIESLGSILVPAEGGAQIPLRELAKIEYVRGPMMIKSEDTFLVGYVLFDKKTQFAEVDVVEDAQRYLEQKQTSGELDIPAGVSYRFAGNYENQIRSEKRLRIVMPLALFSIFLVLYFEFRRVAPTLIVYTGVFVAAGGGFIMMWLYAQPWFLNFSVLGVNMQDLLQVHSFNLSVAVWVGFLALFGVITDDGVLITTYLDQSFADRNPRTVHDIREATVYACLRRIRPAMMTTVTTILALIPVLTSTGRGSDIMLPMAIPSFGGLTIEVISVFIVPVLYCLLEEWKRIRRAKYLNID